MTRKITPSDFEGKTVKTVDAKAVNQLVFEFTNGTSLTVDVDRFPGGVYGMVVYE